MRTPNNLPAPYLRRTRKKSLILLVFALVIAAFFDTEVRADPNDLLCHLEQLASSMRSGLTPNQALSNFHSALNGCSSISSEGMAYIFPCQRLTSPSVAEQWHTLMGQNSWCRYNSTPRVTVPWAHFQNFDSLNPLHSRVQSYAVNLNMEEVIHAWSSLTGPNNALKYTPAYAEYLQRTGARYDSEAFVTAMLKEHFGIEHTPSELSIYPERIRYAQNCRGDLIPESPAGLRRPLRSPSVPAESVRVRIGPSAPTGTRLGRLAGAGGQTLVFGGLGVGSAWAQGRELQLALDPNSSVYNDAYHTALRTNYELREEKLEVLSNPNSSWWERLLASAFVAHSAGCSGRFH